jgi:transposase
MPNVKLQVPRDRAALEHRRREALELIDSGISQAEAARRLGVVRQAVSQWVAARRAGGTKSVASKGKPGPKTAPNEATRKRIEAAMIKGPKANGYRNDLWTLRRVAEVIERITGTKPSTTRTWNLMREMGWSCQRPARRARQQNAEQVRGFVDQVWAAVKKTPASNGKGSFSPTKAD